MESDPELEGAPSCLLVRVQPAPPDPEKMRHKLQLHFQSPRSSGGGECTVAPQDPHRGLYRVRFASPDVKKRVKARGEQCVKNTDISLSILPDPNMMDTSEGSLPKDLTNAGAEKSPIASHPLQLQKDFENRQLDKHNASNLSASVPRKVFLSVTATLNTDLLSKEARDQAIHLFPTLTTDISWHGVEKVTGDYEEIEKLYRYFEQDLRHVQSFPNSLQPKSQNGLEERDVYDGEGKNSYQEEDMQVPPAIFEYFYFICQEQLKDLEQRFNVKLIRKEGGSSEMTSVRFTPAGSPAGIEKAKEVFVESIQKLASDLTQEKIPFTDSKHCSSTQAMFNTVFKNVLVKRERDTLIICGPSKEVATAKGLVEDAKAAHFPQRPAVRSLRTGIEVESDLFELLEPALVKAVDAITKKYDAEMDKKCYLSSPKVHIRFKLRSDKSPDGLQQVYESFLSAYENALKIPVEKVIPLALSVDQKRKLGEESSRVYLREVKDQLVVFGYPEDVFAFEKNIKKFLKIDARRVPGSPLTSEHIGNLGATSGVSAMQHGDHKPNSFPSSAPPSIKAAAQEEICSICMDKIHQKEVLPKCKHEFCKDCIAQAMKYKPVCPVCNVFYGKMEGNQPPGNMKVEKDRTLRLPGYERSGTIVISYSIPDGFQEKNHPNPGRRYSGTYRKAYLPDNSEGREILKLLERAFDQKLIFTVGQSRTTGMTNVVTWNDIHHKTSISGGPEGFGYPDPLYLNRVREELKAKGIE